MKSTDPRRLSTETITLIQTLLRDSPNLTNKQIAEIAGCSDSSVGAERRGVRAKRERARQEAFEAAKTKHGLKGGSVRVPVPVSEECQTHHVMEALIELANRVENLLKTSKV